MSATFGIVDLFAGPGGLGEGFASLAEGGHSPFRIGISVEKEASAHRTLTLRAFLREYRARHGTLPDQFIDFHAGLVPEPDWSAVDAEAWQLAIDEARALELGTVAAATAIAPEELATEVSLAFARSSAGIPHVDPTDDVRDDKRPFMSRIGRAFRGTRAGRGSLSN